MLEPPREGDGLTVLRHARTGIDERSRAGDSGRDHRSNGGLYTTSSTGFGRSALRPRALEGAGEAARAAAVAGDGARRATDAALAAAASRVGVNPREGLSAAPLRSADMPRCRPPLAGEAGRVRLEAVAAVAAASRDDDRTAGGATTRGCCRCTGPAVARAPSLLRCRGPALSVGLHQSPRAPIKATSTAVRVSSNAELKFMK